MVRWWVLVQRGREFAIWSNNKCFVVGIFQSIVGPKLKLDSPVRKSSSPRKQATTLRNKHICQNVTTHHQPCSQEVGHYCTSLLTMDFQWWQASQSCLSSLLHACFAILSVDGRGGSCCLVLGDSYMMRCPSILFFLLEDSFLVSGVCLLEVVF